MTSSILGLICASVIIIVAFVLLATMARELPDIIEDDNDYE